MVYINADGSTSEKRKWGFSIVRDFIVGVFDFVGMFFRTVTWDRTALEAERGQRRTTYSERQYRNGRGGGGGPNVRGLNRMGTARAAAGG